MNNPGCTGASDVRTCSKRQDAISELPGCLPQQSHLDLSTGFGLRSINLATTTTKESAQNLLVKQRELMSLLYMQKARMGLIVSRPLYASGTVL